ncbi:hypothetical protein ZTR_04736 [Talaromyces verruculosus]|nr:hypothetical protein ZTR_04736 [Talaromyces verruculosus]
MALAVYLQYVLHEKAVGLGVDVKFDAHVKSIDIKATVDRPKVLIDNGQEYQADLILGADGEHSVCRESLLQRHDPPLSSGDLCFRIAIPAHRIAMDLRLNHLIEPPGVHAWYGPNSHAVTYQLRKNDIFNIVLTVADPGAATIGPQPEEKNVLLEYCQSWDTLFLGLLELSDKVLKWTLLQTNHLGQWMHPSGKLILIGDSAHATLPYLAQGAAMVFESAYMLTMMLSHHPPTESLPSLVAAFVRSRQLRTMETRQRSKYMRDQCQLMDGPEQEERDRILSEDEPSEGFPNPWADPVYQNVLWGFDAHQGALGL